MISELLFKILFSFWFCPFYLVAFYLTVQKIADMDIKRKDKAFKNIRHYIQALFISAIPILNIYISGCVVITVFKSGFSVPRKD